MTQEVLKLALEALETYHGYMEPLLTVFGGPRVPAEQSTTWKVEQAITAIKEALAEHAMQEVQRLGQEIEQKPVAYINVEKRRLEFAEPIKWHTPTVAKLDRIPLFTQRTWVGLTDDERRGLREWQEIQEKLGPVWAPMMLYMYEAIEAKLKEKNT